MGRLGQQEAVKSNKRLVLHSCCRATPICANLSLRSSTVRELVSLDLTSAEYAHLSTNKQVVTMIVHSYCFSVHTRDWAHCPPSPPPLRVKLLITPVSMHAVHARRQVLNSVLTTLFLRMQSLLPDTHNPRRHTRKSAFTGIPECSTACV